MNERGPRSAGLSLLEVLISVGMLSVGVIAAALLQASALEGSAKAEQIQDATRIAEVEMNLRRHMSLSTLQQDACESGLPDGYGCTVDVVPCIVVNVAFSCSDSVTDPDAHQVYVSVTTPDAGSFSHQMVVAEGSSVLASAGGQGGGGGAVSSPAVDPPAVDPPEQSPPAVDPPEEDPPAVDPPAVDPPDEDPPACWPPGQCKKKK